MSVEALGTFCRSESDQPRGHLHIYCTDYPRGAIVKLAASMIDEALVKFSIQKDGQGTYTVRSPGGYIGKRQIWQTDLTGQTYEAATGYAIRECERIRDSKAGGMDART